LSNSATTLEEIASEHYDPPGAFRKIQFIIGNDDTLLNDLERGILDAAILYSVPPNTESWFNPVALDALLFFVHPTNDIDALSMAELQAIFSDNIKNWTGVGGSDLPIELISREPGSGARAILEERVLIGRPLAAAALITPNPTAVQTAIAAAPGALGFDMMGALDGPGTLSINGNSANPASTASQEYPLTAPLYFVSSEEPAGELRAFLSWLQSPDGQSVLGDIYGRVR